MIVGGMFSQTKKQIKYESSIPTFTGVPSLAEVEQPTDTTKNASPSSGRFPQNEQWP